jgi:peptide deformylase
MVNVIATCKATLVLTMIGVASVRVSRVAAFSVVPNSKAAFLNGRSGFASGDFRSFASFQKAGKMSRLSRGMQRYRPSWMDTISSDSILTRLLASPTEEVDPGVVQGTDLRIVKYPHPALRQPNAIIGKEDLKDGSIAKLAKEMFLLMYAAEGVGLAAPQVGVNQRLMVYNPTGDSKKWLDEVVLVNPRIVEKSEATDVETEGCLSFPDMNGPVERPKWIKVEAMNLKGKTIKRKYTGWEARIFQHEYDHLDGVVYIDRLTEEGRQKVQPRLDELVKDHGPGGAL